MYTAAAARLMTDLSINPLMVSLVQALSSLPMFLLALPAGALADIVDKRRLLIWAECGISIIAATLAVLVWHDRITPVTLLIFTFLLGTGAAIVSGVRAARNTADAALEAAGVPRNGPCTFDALAGARSRGSDR